MSIKQIIPTTGKWFAMTQNDEDPESCYAVPIAAWARMSDDDDDTEVIPLVACDDDGFTHRLVLVNAERIIGICDASGLLDPNWQDRAKDKHRNDELRAQSEEATPKHASEKLDLLAKRHTDLTASAMLRVLVALSNGAGYLHEPSEMHAFVEVGFIEPLVGYYKVTPLGKHAIALLKKIVT